MAKTILDSNIWIAHFLLKDPNHKKAFAILNDLDLRTVYLHDYVILEVVSVLRVKSNANIAAKAVQMFKELQLKKLNFDDENDLKLYDHVLNAAYPKLSYVDLLLLSLSEKGFNIISFDKNLNRALKSYAKKK